MSGFLQYSAESYFSASGCSKDPHWRTITLQLYFQSEAMKFLLNIHTDCHYIHLPIFIPLPETILIAATITNEMIKITTTQKPAMP